MEEVKRWKPEVDEYYWYIDFTKPDLSDWLIWVNDSMDRKFYNSGMVFRNKQDAQRVAELILHLTGVE